MKIISKGMIEVHEAFQRSVALKMKFFLVGPTLGPDLARLQFVGRMVKGDFIWLVTIWMDGHISKNSMLCPLMARKTQILCTHNTQAIHMANMFIVMKKGTMKWAGCSTEFHLSFIPQSHHEISNTTDIIINPNSQTLPAILPSVWHAKVESGADQMQRGRLCYAAKCKGNAIWRVWV